MLVRHLVNTWLRQTAQQELQKAVSEMAHSAIPQPEGEPRPDKDERGEGSLPCDAAFVFALGVESGGFVDRLGGMTRRRYKNRVEYEGLLKGRSVLAVDSGVGALAAGQATERILSRHHPAWVISTGFAGALCRALRRGNVLMAQTVVDVGGNELEVGLKMDPQAVAATRGLHLGRLLTVDHLVRGTEEKRALGEKHKALACDMETAAVAEVCRRHKTRFLSIRVISDALEDELPPELEALVNQKTSAARLGAAAGAIFRRPSSAKDMWQLKEDAIKASDRLARFLEGVLDQLT
jgi:adenosylhomocysteine nucleosidase